MGKSQNDRGMYRAIYVTLWDDPDFINLPPEIKLILLNLRTGPLTNMPCIYRFYREAIRKQTGYPSKVVDRALDTLSDTHWITIEEDIIWVRNALRYDPNIYLNNPKHIEAIKKIIMGLPKLKIVIDFCTYYGITIPYQIPYPIPYGIHTDTDTDTDTDTEKEEEEEEEGIANPIKIFTLFNEICKYLPKPKELNKSRKEALRIRIKEHSTLLWWKEVFEIADFVLIPGKDGRKSWSPDFDWLIKNDQNSLKVIEGKYPTRSNPDGYEIVRRPPDGSKN